MGGLFGGGGGGGGQQQAVAPSSQRVEQTSIPDYARPYVESMLGQTAALTDINQNPYQPYAGQRIAGFTPMQAQGFENVANQQVAGQIGEGSNLASQVGQTAMGAFTHGQQLGQAAQGYGASGASIGGQGQALGVEGGGRYGQLGVDIGQQGQQLGVSGGAGYGQMGAGFGTAGVGLGQQALSTAPLAGMYGQQGANFGQRGVQASEQGFGAGQRFEGMATDPGAQQAYMSPYMQNVVDFQKQQAIRDYDIAQQTRSAQAVGSGAYGGSRQAVAEAEANRALMNQLGGIQATGTQQAFADAQKQMQFGSQLGLQGLQAGYQGLQTGIQGAQTGLQGLQGIQEAYRTGLQGTAQGMQGAQIGLQGVDRQLAGTAQGMQGAQIGLQGVDRQLAGTAQGMQGAQIGIQGVNAATAAGQYGLQGLGESTRAAQLLGQLGQAEFGQQRDITNDMMRAGAVQQAQQQQGLDVEYQDFLKSQNYPYQQLAFSSDMLRGLPLSQSAANVYTAPPSTASQLGGLGTTALGLYGMSGGFKAKGGMVGKGYAQGGLMAAQSYKNGGYANGGEIARMSTEQLTKLLESPNLTPMEVAMIEEQLMIRRRMESNPEAAGIMAPRQQASGIDSIPTGEMVPEEMAGGGIVAFSKGGLKRPEDEMDYRDMIRQRLAAQETADPFAKSQEEVQAIRKEMTERKERAPYEALAMAGLGMMSGTSQYGLTNAGLGGLEGLKSYGRSMAQDTADKKLLLQQQVEAEKSKYARDTGNLNALIQAQGQKDTKEIGLLNARQYGVAATEASKTRAFNQAQVGYLDAIDKARKAIAANNKYNDLPDAKIDEMARDSVNANLSPQFKKILFGDTPMLNAPAAATAAPLPMPKAKADLVKGSVYNTARGPATWDGTQFVTGK
jgi:hypothetical protein